MKERCCLFLVLILTIVFGLPALAAETEMAPPQLPVYQGLPAVRTIEPGVEAADAIMTITPDHTPTIGEPCTWTAVPSQGVDDSGGYRFSVWEKGEVIDNVIQLEALYLPGATDSNSFTYTCYQGITYYLYCDVMDSNGGSVQHYISFNVAPDPQADCVESRVQEIVDECLSQVSGDYEIALWLHDWITSHAYYDLTYERHGAEDILYFGTGVCDSYSKLYLKLLRAAGLEAIRVTGDANGGDHAWNAVKIEGDWCQVDTTWDDPSGSSAAVSGNERHDYFGLNDGIMRLDHTYEPSVSCDTLEHCALRNTDVYRTWLYNAMEEIDSGIQRGCWLFEADNEGMCVYSVSGNSMSYTKDPGRVARNLTLAAALLEMEDWEFAGFNVPIHFTYQDFAIIRVEADLSDYTLQLPADTTEIQYGAFQGADHFLAAEIPAGARNVGANAFSGCTGLRKVTWLSDDVTIEAGAFDGASSDMVFVCAAGSTAQSYALEHGIQVMLK